MKLSFLASGGKNSQTTKRKKTTRERGLLWFPISRKLSFDEERGESRSEVPLRRGEIYMIGYLFIVTERIQEDTPPTV